MMRRLIILIIDFYRTFLSPYLPCECRYYPTCSQYAREAIEKKGIIKGVLVSLKRILRCNPMSEGGYDPVE